MSKDLEVPQMSATTRHLLGKVRCMIPPMSDKFHKGQLGRIAVIGGSEDYTGAPYFSAMASARLGCDMSHVICTPGAGAVIKTYSPNLMVHPLMRQSPPAHPADQSHAREGDPDADSEHISGKVIEMLSRLHVLVIGPGLGRDPLMQETVARVIRAARDQDMPMVLDADALKVVHKHPDLVRGYKNVVLTPNVVEFKGLCDALDVKVENESTETSRVESLARALGGVTIIQKGGKDFISNGRETLTSDLEGGKKRSGGQGDTLTGTVATFLGWRKAYLNGLWKDPENLALGAEEMMGLAAFGGSAVTRECSRLAFLKKGRSLQASDLTDEVHNAFMGLFGEVEDDAGAAKL
ncbi:ATP-dependent (S)-NAD(P)H-hydrate dehydratase [Cladobotryum mycophilum]|uniref:ATP-dependent (S)-NAD(P)H-hydrate dehydratase n=1 Tax=Cladobotryum mycophilum TaxID=491253 RepID=A0ABR0SFF1_9HYPO